VGDTPRALNHLEQAQHAAGLDVRALRWRVQLMALEPQAALVQRGEVEAARQRVRIADGWVTEAAAETVEARGGRWPASLARLRATLWQRLATLTGDPADLDEAERHTAVLRRASPYNVQDALAWADLAASRGERSAAGERYRAVLELRERGYLDAADPLRPEELERARRGAGLR
jgi:predicted Zn-dependent protease